MTAQLFAAIAPVILEKMFGGGKEAKQGSSYSQGQQQAQGGILDQIQKLQQSGAGDISQNQNYQQGQDWLSSLYNDPEFFKQFEAPLQRQFSEQTAPDLANRFAGMGSHGSFGTGFRNQLAREGSNLSTNIAALRGGLQQQGANQSLQYAQQPFNNLQSLYQNALGSPTNNIQYPATPGPFGNIFGSLAGSNQEGSGQQDGASSANGANPLMDLYNSIFGGNKPQNQGSPSYNVSLGQNQQQQPNPYNLPKFGQMGIGQPY